MTKSKAKAPTPADNIAGTALLVSPEVPDFSELFNGEYPAEDAPAPKQAVITKNADTVVFAASPFYNMSNVRKGAINLIVRSSSDPKKVDAIRETLETLLRFLEVRAEHGEKVRAADVAAEAVATERRNRAAEDKQVAKAEEEIAKATKTKATWVKVLKTLGR